MHPITWKTPANVKTEHIADALQLQTAVKSIATTAEIWKCTQSVRCHSCMLLIVLQKSLSVKIFTWLMWYSKENTVQKIGLSKAKQCIALFKLKFKQWDTKKAVIEEPLPISCFF